MAILFITTGLIGSGKSAVSEFISKEFNAEILSTDIARKNILKTKKDEKIYYGKGIYTKESRERVYEELFEIVKNKLKNKKNVIIDASFQKQKQRDRAKEIAEKTNSDFIIIYCSAPENKIKGWLIRRPKEKTASDATIDIFEDFKRNFDKVKIDENTVIAETIEFKFKKDLKEKINNKLKSLP